MTLDQIAQFVCAKVGKTDESSVSICKDFIRQRHELIYDSAPWKDSIGIWRVPAPPDGRVARVKVTNGGSGYTSAPVVTLSGSGGAAAIAKIRAGSVYEVQVTDFGTGYTSAPSVSFSGGGGTGAAATAYIYESQEELILPADCARVMTVRYGDCVLGTMQLQSMMLLDPAVIDTVGTPVMFAEVHPVGLPWYPTGNYPYTAYDYNLLIVNIDANDDSKIVQVEGTYVGVPQRETVSLTTAGVITSLAFHEVTKITKEPTVGYVTIGRAPIGDADDFRLESWEVESSFPRIRIMNPIDLDMTDPKEFLVVGKRRLRPMRNDYDVPMIRGIDNALIAFAQGDMLERQRQYSKAQAKYQEAAGLIQVAKDVDHQQSASQARIIPDEGVIGWYSRDDFGF